MRKPIPMGPIPMEPITVGEVLNAVARRLTEAGVSRPRLDARLLLAHVLGTRIEAVLGYPDRLFDPDLGGRLAEMVERRARREPMSHLLGVREFWSLPFQVTADTLDPRADSETLVEAALSQFPDREMPLRVLDLGTGTGCLLLALLKSLPNAFGVGIDSSDAACGVARANALALGLDQRSRIEVGNWGEGLEGPFDLIVSNPPYIPDGDIDQLEPEVALYEPRLALAGGSDGLDCYRAIGPHLARLLVPDGRAVIEVGAGQADDVEAILVENGLTVLGRRRDLAGIERCLIASL